MLALQEFGITECSSNYTLVEVTVDGGTAFVGQKRLPDTQTNLAERIGLASRYYIKNLMSSDQLIPEDVSSELAKESSVNLLQLNALEVAIQLMVEDFTIFRQIEQTEYIDSTFKLDSKFGTPNLSKFDALVNKESNWVKTEVVSETNLARRVKIVKQFIKIAQCCYKQTQNFNSMINIITGLDDVNVRRLKKTWDGVPVKYSRSLAEMLTVIDPTRNFSRYRNLVQNARAPLIPWLPMVMKDIAFIDLGNKSKVEQLVNFEKLRMLAKEIRQLSNMCSAPLDLLSMLEQAGAEFADPWRTLNPAHSSQIKPVHVNTTGTMKKGSLGMRGGGGGGGGGLGGGGLNARKMYEEAQMVRRVKAYINRMPVITDEDELSRLSKKCEPPSSTSTLSLAAATSKKSLILATSSSSNISQPTAVKSNNPAPSASKRSGSPTPSNHSTNSSNSHLSEGRKSNQSGANQQQPKFGAESPQAVRKLMSLSEPGKSRPRKLTSSVSSKSSLHSNTSPTSSPSMNTRRRQQQQQGQGQGQTSHGRSKSEVTVPVSLSAESSSVTTLPALRRSATSNVMVAQQQAKVSSSSRSNKHGKSSSSSNSSRVARTVSRDTEDQVSAV